MNTGEHGVAFLYRTLGCYHSLQPTRNAFEAPSIPCLTDDGYVRWQTLQLLLCPEEHANMLQKALQIYQVPRRAGGFFPRAVPRECFPARPDADMEKWHRFVTSQISQENYQRRLKYSPYQSPQPEGNNTPGGYFARAIPVRRPSPHSRRKDPSSEEELARQAAAREARRRRSSVPDIASPGGTLYGEKEPPNKSRSRSANRVKSNEFSPHQRQRSYTSAQPHYYPPPSPRGPPTVRSRRQESHESSDSSRRRYQPDDRERPSASRSSTASDEGSDDSYADRRKSRSSGEDSTKRRPRWGSSLMPNFFLSSNKRRHSSDGRVPTVKVDSSSPRRNNSIRKYRTEGPEYSPSGRQLNLPERPVNGVRFSNSFNPNEVPVRPDGTAYQQAPAPPPSSYRYSEPQANVYPSPHTPNSRPLYPSPIDAISPGVSSNHFEARKQGLPVRISTVSGVNGRRYAPPEPKSAEEPAAFSRRDRTSSMRNFATSTVI